MLGAPAVADGALVLGLAQLLALVFVFGGPDAAGRGGLVLGALAVADGALVLGLAQLVALGPAQLLAPVFVLRLVLGAPVQLLVLVLVLVFGGPDAARTRPVEAAWCSAPRAR